MLKKFKILLLVLSLIMLTNLSTTICAIAMTIDEVIVDDKDAGFKAVGDWTTNNYTSTNHNGNHLYTGTATDYSIYTPNLKGGVYEIYAWVPINNAGSSNVMNVEIYGLDEKSVATYDIMSVAPCWLKIGDFYSFGAGTNGYIKVSNGSAPRVARVDAFKFVKVDDENMVGLTSQKNIGVSDPIVLTFSKAQMSGIVEMISLVDATTGAFIPSDITLGGDDVTLTINPYDNLELNKAYTVVVDDEFIVGNKKWVVQTGESVLEKLVINNKGDGAVSADSNGAYTEEGTWTYSGLLGINDPYHTNAGISNQTRANLNNSEIISAIYTPQIVTTGYYKVSVYKFYTNGDSVNTVTTVNGADGAVSFDKNYVIRRENSQYISEWENIGVYKFNSGADGFVKLTRKTISSVMRADAVKFERVVAPAVSISATTNNQVTLLFSKPIDITTMNYLSVVLKKDGVAILATIEPQNDGRTVFLKLSSQLNSSDLYTASFNEMITDVSGSKLIGGLDYEFGISVPQYKINNIVAGTEVVVNATNTMGEAKRATVIVATYSGMQLANAEIIELNIPNGSYNTDYTIEHHLDVQGKELKAFVWNGLTDLMPLK